MYSIYNRDDLGKLKNLQETKPLLRKERSKEKLGKHEFHYDMEKVFEPVTARQEETTAKQIKAAEAATQKQLQVSEKQLQALRDSSLAIQESTNTLQKSIKEGIQEYDKITKITKGTFIQKVIQQIGIENFLKYTKLIQRTQ